MGWFWAETASAPPPSILAPHPIPDAGAKPPPSCPMHNSSAGNSPFRTTPKATPPTTKSCPYAPPTASLDTKSPESTSRPDERSFLSRINPLNLMPTSSNERAASQTYDLSLEREGSSIPRGASSPSAGGRGCPVKHKSPSSPSPSSSVQPSDSAYADEGSDRWQYPSPQQMYNALLRKGYTDTDPTAVPAMVSVHNFLNEGAWAEILEWERRFHAGLWNGWQISSHGGEEASQFGAMIELEESGWSDAMASMRTRAARLARENGKSADESRVGEVPEPRLLRFEGRPDEMTPRAQWLQMLGKVWPSQYSSAPPFDRHDWHVLRHSPDGSTREVRYVIDYYSGPDESTGQPVFYLDVRPAIDGPTGFGERILRWGGDAWWKASGGEVRERNELQRQVQEAVERRRRGTS